jgi:hypothetical protein
VIEDRWSLDDGYRIELFTEQDAVSERDVIDLWSRELPLSEAERNRRVHEVLLVAMTDRGELAGVSSAYLKRNEQLDMDLWYYRAFVSDRHRQSNVAVNLALIGRDHLEQRFVSGADARAGGMIYEVEHEGLKRHFDDALWLPTDFTFIGENERGDHVRVRYFTGALAPEPALGSG